MKAGILALALAVLVVEGFFVYRWYDRYYGYDAASGTATGSAVSSEDTTGFYSASNGTSTDQRTDKSTEQETGQDAGGANSGENAEESTSVTMFTHTATVENSRGDYTYLSHPRLDGDPNAVVLAAVSQQDGESATGEAYDHNIGVWYESIDQNNKWAIFNQDLTAVPAGTTFEVVLPPASESFVHRAEPANTEGNTTYLDNPLTNGDPDATPSVTQNWNPGGSEMGVYNNHPVDVFYDEDVEQWAVYNNDEAPMPDGAAFNVAVSGSAEGER